MYYICVNIQASLKFWLEHGVDGFRFYGVEYLVESSNWTQTDISAMVVFSVALLQCLSSQLLIIFL